MDNDLFPLIIFGFTYVLLVYIVFTIIRRRKMNNNKDGNDDGGIEIYTPPKLDLPPGISLPGGGPSRRINTEELEEMLE